MHIDQTPLGHRSRTRSVSDRPSPVPPAPSRPALFQPASFRPVPARPAQSRRRWAVGVVAGSLGLASTLVVGSTAAAHTPASPSHPRSVSTCSAAGLGSVLVGDGDTWFDLARSADVSMRSLWSVNDADESTMLHPGDLVCLPGGATTASDCTPSNAPTHAVESGDTWWDLARRAGVSMSQLLSTNGADENRIIRPGQTICLPVGSSIGALSSGSARSASAPASASGSSRSASASGSTFSASRLEALPMRGPCWYADSWGAPRGDGRRHQGVDLFAALDSHVYAVVDGTLTGRAWDQPGRRAGNAWWLTADDGTYYFYAHLSDFAPDLTVGSRVQAGQIIGFMGNTGNSAFPHLHFEIHPRGGAGINPYPVLRELGGCKTGGGYRQPGGWVAD